MKRYVITILFALVANMVVAQTDSTDVKIATDRVTLGTIDANAPSNVNTLKKRARKLKIDREINKTKFVFKGETMLGLTVSYATLDTEDTDIGLILDNLQFSGSSFSVKPFFGYFYRDNNCLGLRLGYTHNFVDLGSAKLNLGEANDIDLSLNGIYYDSNLYSFGLLHRTYVALDRRGRFSFFAEWELSGSYGRSEFKYLSGDAWKGSISDTYKCKFSFNPGIAAYIFPNVCASVSFGMGGLQYTHIKQMDLNGNYTGKRDFSKLRFRLNLADINIGVCIHLWSKKKEGSK